MALSIGATIQPQNDKSVEDKWVEAVDDMAALTRAGQIKWNTTDPNSSYPPLGKDALGREIGIQAVYEADYKEKKLELQETGVQLPRAGTRLAGGGGSGGWGRSVVQEAALQTADARLRLLDANRNVVFVFPQSSNMVELLAAVKYQIADVESFLDMLRQDVSAYSSV